MTKRKRTNQIMTAKKKSKCILFFSFLNYFGEKTKRKMKCRVTVIKMRLNVFNSVYYS